MIALVPLINLPFDWASIGFTRALLRRGCEADAPSPLWLGLIDFAIGAILLLLLACALIFALQLVDHIVGVDIIDVRSRLIRLYAEPRKPENWWIYFTLFSTLAPSALNAIVGMCSLATWCQSPAAREHLIERIRHLTPATGKERTNVTLRLLTPVFVGTALACVAIWGVWIGLLHAAAFGLTWFLWLAVAFEWLLTTGLGL